MLKKIILRFINISICLLVFLLTISTFDFAVNPINPDFKPSNIINSPNNTVNTPIKPTVKPAVNPTVNPIINPTVNPTIKPDNFAFIINNPYELIDFDTYNLSKSNFHAHEGRKVDPDYKAPNIVNEYEQKGYDILCISEHNVIIKQDNFIPNLFPWSKHGVTKTSLFPINGCEVSHIDNIISLFSNEYYPGLSLNEVLKKSQEVNALTFLAHPARYDRTMEYYKSIFTKYKNVVGLEAFNWKNYDARNMVIWDNVLTELMPNRPVWGLANDDSHNAAEVGFGWNNLLLKEDKDITETTIRSVLMKGQFFFSFKTEKNAQVPQINSIKINGNQISIDAQFYTQIEWISSEGRIIAQGKSLDLNALYKSKNPPKKYVRAYIKGDNAGLCTQPFGLIESN